MQRSMNRLTLRSGAFASCLTLRGQPSKDDTFSVEKFARDFKMRKMEVHPRSQHMYVTNAKGADAGTRNESVCMNYEAFTPRDLNGIFAMPHPINLLTVVPLYCAVLCIASVAWGIFYWDLYCQRTYETVLIARPEALR